MGQELEMEWTLNRQNMNMYLQMDLEMEFDP